MVDLDFGQQWDLDRFRGDYNWMTSLELGMDYTGWKPEGNDVISFKIIEPPDDRYIPGYSIVQADGDKKTVAPRLKDLNVPFSLYGIPIPITFGVRRLYGNIIWAIPLKETVKKRKKKGKGGPEETLIEYLYYATFGVGFGYAGNTDPVKRDILRMWGDGSLMYDRRSSGQVSIPGLNFKFYPGSETQPVDSVIEEREGIGETPAFRGLMYARIFELPVQDFGNRPPAVSIEIGDATAETYKINNWQPDNVEGDATQDHALVDFAAGQVVTISEANDAMRTYLIEDGTQILAQQANQVGIGWDNITGDYTENALAHSTQLELQQGTPTYFDWLESVWCPAQTGSSACRPLGWFSPYTGEAARWIGSVQTLLDAAYPLSEPPVFTYNAQARLPRSEWAYGTYVYDYTGSKSFFFVQGFYGDDKYMIMHDRDGTTRLVGYRNNPSEGPWTCGCAGQIEYGKSRIFMAQGTRLDRYTISMTLERGGTAENPAGLELDQGWLTLDSTPTHMLYQESDNSLIIFHGTTSCSKYMCADKSLAWSVTVAGKPMIHHSKMRMNEISAGIYAWQTASGGNTYEINLATGEITTFTVTNGKLHCGGGTVFSSTKKILVGCGTSGSGSFGANQTQSKNEALVVFYYDRLDDERMPLADFILGMALYAGYAEADIEIDAEIDDLIDGAIIAGTTTYRSIINPVLALYRIDMIESDGKVKFKRRAQGSTTVDFTVADGDTLQRDESGEGASFTLRREEEVAVPQRVNVRYMDKSLSYNWSMQTATRSQFITTNDSTTQITYEIPLMITASEAKELAYKTLWYSWNSRVSHSFSLGPEFLKVEPGDVGAVTARGFTFKVKAVKVTYNNDFSLNIQSSSFLSDEAVSIEADPGGGYDQTIPSTAAIESIIIDGPLLRTTDDREADSEYNMYVYIGPKARATTMTSGAVYTSLNSGTTWTQQAANLFVGFVGIVATVPALPDNNLATDFENTITVKWMWGDSDELVTATSAQLREGYNIAAYGADGRWEYIQYQTVTDNGNGTYTLSGLFRGYNGTEYAMDSHQINDRFVLLNEDWTNAFGLANSTMETTFLYKSVTANATFDLAQTKQLLTAGYGALPWPPHGHEISRSLSALTGDITLSWKRRSRTLDHLKAYVEAAPLGTHESNNYKVSIKRWPYYTWAFSGGTWNATLVEDEVVEYTVTGATSLTLTAAQIRTAELYEFEVPDNMTSSGSTFTAQPGSYIAANEAENEQIVDLGYDDFVAFAYLEVMIQQETDLPVASGYGPGFWTRVYIKDL